MPVAQILRGRSGGLPLIRPSPAWNGTANSGFPASTPPADPTRVNAKPAMQWHTVGWNRVTTNQTIFLDADAVAGMSKVRFHVEGNVVDVTGPVLLPDADANGNPRTRLGFGFVLDVAVAAAQATGTLNIYAEGFANQSSGTIQNRVIGPLQILPRATTIAKTYTITPSLGGTGGSYATLLAATTQFRTDTPESAEFVFTETNTYNLDDYTASYTGHTGRVVFRATGGAVATLVRGPSFVAAPSGTLADWQYAWTWMPPCGPIEFRGAGIVLDMKNWCQLLVQGTNPHWFNGCTITNSIGARDSLYWNKQSHPGFITKDGGFSYSYSYFDDVTVTHVGGSNGLTGKKLSGLKQNDGGANHDMCGFIVNCYEKGTNSAFFTSQLNAIAINYTGAGTARVVVSGFTLDCQVNGVTVGGVFPITISVDGMGLQPTSSTYYQISALAAAINGIAGGAWVASASDTTRAGISVLQEGYTQVIATSTAGQFLACYLPHHIEWQHFIGGTPFENAIFRGNVDRGATYNTSILNFESTGNDIIVKGNSWEDAVPSDANGGLWGKHIVFTNNFYDGALQINTSDAYGLVAENVCRSIFAAPGSPVLPIIKDNFATSVVAGAAGSGGNVIAASNAAVYAGFTDKVNGDFRPTGALLANLKARLDLYDGRNAARTDPDAIGPWKSGGSAPVYPY